MGVLYIVLYIGIFAAAQFRIDQVISQNKNRKQKPWSVPYFVGHDWRLFRFVSHFVIWHGKRIAGGEC